MKTNKPRSLEQEVLSKFNWLTHFRLHTINLSGNFLVSGKTRELSAKHSFITDSLKLSLKKDKLTYMKDQTVSKYYSLSEADRESKKGIKLRNKICFLSEAIFDLEHAIKDKEKVSP